VADSDRAKFTEWSAILAAPHVRVAVPDVPYYVDKIRELLPAASIRTFDNMKDLLSQPTADFDAIAFPAERGSAWTLIYPKYTVVVPQPSRVRLPLAYPLARHDHALASFLDSWVELKEKDGTVLSLYDYWILGRDAAPPARRWSVIRNVLHWVD
jgi:hypothetical protein